MKANIEKNLELNILTLMFIPLIIPFPMTNKRPQGIKIDLSRLQVTPATTVPQKSSIDPKDKKDCSED